VVARRVLLLVGAVLLLVDRDEAKIAKRQEDRRAGPHDEVERPFRRVPPHLRAFAWAERRVVERHAFDPSLAERVERLRRERDLGHEDERLPPLADRGERGVHVDRGLPASGHAVEEEGTERALLKRPLDLVERRHLVLVQLRSRRRGRRVPSELVGGRLRGRAALERGGRWRRGVENLTEGSGVVVGHPPAELDQLRRQGEPRLWDARDGPDRPGGTHRLLRHDGAPEPPSAKGNEHAQPGLELLVLGEFVDECVVDGDRDGHADEAHRGRMVAPGWSER
jgi:hypothetical protein